MTISRAFLRISSTLRGKDYIFETKPGLFSKDKIDLGSQFLIENMSISKTDMVLDLGCGYGVIGIVAANLASEGKVYLVDSDIRAIKYSLINAQLNNISNIEVKISDGFEEVSDLKFDVVVSNPPSHLPKETIIEFITGAKRQLNKNGKLYFVTEKRIKPLIKREFEKIFGNWEEVKVNDSYSVSLAYQT